MSLFTASSLSAIPEFALVLGIMVLVHEAGHFFAAKLCGVRVEAFAIGFGKRLFGVVHNGTDYCVNLIPFGGYVKMASEQPGDVHTGAPDEFLSHPRWQRAVIALAGPVANFLLAFVLLAGLYMLHNEVPAYVSQPVVADYVSPGSPSAATGIQAGDRVVAFDGQQNPDFQDLEQRSALNFNQSTPFSYLHNGQRVDSHLFIRNSGRPEDFDFSDLGLVPLMQTQPLEVAALSDSTSPAARAGLQPGDRILAVDTLQPHSVQALIAYLQDGKGRPIFLTVQRRDVGGSAEVTRKLDVTPALTDTKEGKGYRLGFLNTQPPTVVRRMPAGQALAKSASDNLKNSRLIFDVLHRLFTRQVSVKSLSSPIGMGVQVHEAFQMAGWYPIIATMAMISLNLGIFNLLPIPILDGGMLLFLAIESIMRRDLNPQLKERVLQVAFVCIVLFAAVVIFNDITRLLPTHAHP